MTTTKHVTNVMKGTTWHSHRVTIDPWKSLELVCVKKGSNLAAAPRHHPRVASKSRCQWNSRWATPRVCESTSMGTPTNASHRDWDQGSAWSYRGHVEVGGLKGEPKRAHVRAQIILVEKRINGTGQWLGCTGPKEHSGWRGSMGQLEVRERTPPGTKEKGPPLRPRSTEHMRAEEEPSTD